MFGKWLVEKPEDCSRVHLSYESERLEKFTLLALKKSL